MSGKIPRPFGSIALVATLLISGMRVSVPASADDCLAAPNFPAPQGSHWYYRLDWATRPRLGGDSESLLLAAITVSENWSVSTLVANPKLWTECAVGSIDTENETPPCGASHGE